MVTNCHRGYLPLPWLLSVAMVIFRHFQFQYSIILFQSGNTACGSSVLGQLRPIIVNLIEKEREYVQSDLRKNRSQFIKNIASISQNITGGRNYVPNTVSPFRLSVFNIVFIAN